MEDRFRLKGWLVEEQRMVNIQGLDFINDSVTAEYQRYKIPNKIILIQCTGLKDKNGILIYEGDIVQAMGMVGREQVGWDNGAYILTHDNDSTRPLGEWHTMCTVVSNIYEGVKEPDTKPDDKLDEIWDWLMAMKMPEKEWLSGGYKMYCKFREKVGSLMGEDQFETSTCGECKWYRSQIHHCANPEYAHGTVTCNTSPDNEACSLFDPQGYTCKDCKRCAEFFGMVICEGDSLPKCKRTTMDTPACQDFVPKGE